MERRPFSKTVSSLLSRLQPDKFTTLGAMWASRGHLPSCNLDPIFLLLGLPGLDRRTAWEGAPIKSRRSGAGYVRPGGGAAEGAFSSSLLPTCLVSSKVTRRLFEVSALVSPVFRRIPLCLGDPSDRCHRFCSPCVDSPLSIGSFYQSGSRLRSFLGHCCCSCYVLQRFNKLNQLSSKHQMPLLFDPFDMD